MLNRYSTVQKIVMSALNAAANTEQPLDILLDRQAYLSLTVCPWKARRVIAIAIDTVARRCAAFIAHPNKNA